MKILLIDVSWIDYSKKERETLRGYYPASYPLAHNNPVTPYTPP